MNEAKNFIQHCALTFIHTKAKLVTHGIKGLIACVKNKRYRQMKYSKSLFIWCAWGMGCADRSILL
jgi:hypothetical protein